MRDQMSVARLIAAGIATLLITVGSVVHAPQAAASSSDIVLNEVLYHAADGTTGVDDDYDFIELANIGATPIDLLGWRIAIALDATFDTSIVLEPGEFVVIAQSATAFQERYGMAPDAVFQGGKLSNSTERIELRDPAGELADVVHYNDDPPWPGAPDGLGPSLERLDVAMVNTGTDSDATNWLASPGQFGSPGLPNGILSAGPIISDVDDGDVRPPSGAPIPVSARVSNAHGVTISYRVGFGTSVTVPMADDDASAGGAGDGVFSALLPAQAPRTLVRYAVNAVNDNGPSRSPSETDTITSHGIVVADPNEPTDLPVFDWYISDLEYNYLLGRNRRNNVKSPIVVAYGDTVIDNALIRVRGNVTRRLAKPSMKIELPNGHLLKFDDLDAPVDEFNLFYRADLPTDIGWEIAEEVGLTAMDFFSMRVYRNNTYWGTGAYLTANDGRFYEEQGYGDASVYKAENYMKRGPTPDLIARQWEKEEGSDDFTEIWEFTNLVDAPANPTQFADLMEAMDVPAVINYWAYVNFLRQVDAGKHNHFFVRNPEFSGRWQVDPWDLNIIGPGTGTLYRSDMRLITQLNRYPEFRAMHDRRLKSIIDSYTPQELIDRYEALYVEAGQAQADDHAKWRQGAPPLDARQKWRTGITTRYALFASRTAPKSRSELPASQSTDRPIEISLVNAASAGMPAIIELTNTSATESFDLSGWTLAPTDLTISAGTVLLPGKTVVVSSNDAALRAATNGVFAAGEFPGGLPASGVLSLTDLQGRVVDSFTLGDG
jgi:hypothetical protein